MKNIQGTAIVRDRGQLTIPDKIRETLTWIAPSSVVSIVTISRNELVIKPYEAIHQPNWIKIWKEIYRARSLDGKRGNLSNFIASDRDNH